MGNVCGALTFTFTHLSKGKQKCTNKKYVFPLYSDTFLWHSTSTTSCPFHGMICFVWTLSPRHPFLTGLNSPTINQRIIHIILKLTLLTRWKIPCERKRFKKLYAFLFEVSGCLEICVYISNN